MLALIALICFPFALWQAWKNIRMAEASPAWPTVDGVVTTAERGRVVLRTQPRITYSYSVNGVPFTSKRVSFVGVVPKQEIDGVLSKYPPGQAVTVHYSPENPVQSILEPGSSPLVVAPFRSLVIILILFILVQALLIFLRWNELKTEKPRVRTYGDESAIEYRQSSISRLPPPCQGRYHRSAVATNADRPDELAEVLAADYFDDP